METQIGPISEEEVGFYFLTKGFVCEVRILRYLSVDAVSNRMQIKEKPGVFEAEVK